MSANRNSDWTSANRNSDVCKPKMVHQEQPRWPSGEDLALDVCKSKLGRPQIETGTTPKMRTENANDPRILGGLVTVDWTSANRNSDVCKSKLTASRERSQRQPKPGSLVGTRKLLLFNKRKEETARFQSVAPNLNLEISLEAKQRNFPAASEGTFPVSE